MRFSCTTLRPGIAALNSIATYGVEAPTPATRLFPLPPVAVGWLPRLPPYRDQALLGLTDAISATVLAPAPDGVHRHHLDAEAVHRIAVHPRVWGCAKRLQRHPAFGGTLRPDHITWRHRRYCRGPEATGAAVPLMDWVQPAPERA